MKSGQLICFEGIDGAGKYTQMELFCQRLKQSGRNPVALNVPDYNGPLGACLKAALQDSAFDKYALQMLFSAERLRHRALIQENLNNGKDVIAERYKWSSHVYPVQRGLDSTWAYNLETPLPDPDISFLINISVSASMSRTGKRDVLEKDAGLLSRCARAYIDLANRSNNWYTINGEDHPERVSDVIWAHYLAHRTSVIQ